MLIQGEAGVGKTRLARDFAASRGAYALAQCQRSDAGVPYASFTRLLRGLDGQQLAQAGLPDGVRQELAQGRPELGAGPQRIGSAEEQRRFGEACDAAVAAHRAAEAAQLQARLVSSLGRWQALALAERAGAPA